MPVVGHQLVTENLAAVMLQPLRQNTLKRFVVGFLAEDLATSIPSVQGMVQPVGFVGAFGS